MTSNVELIRQINDAVVARDVRVVSERLHPDVVWEHNIGVGSLEEGVYRGRENVIRLFERMLEPWEYMRAEQHEIRELEDGSYQIKGELHARHATSAAELVTPYEQRFEIGDGLLVKGKMTNNPSLWPSAGPAAAAPGGTTGAESENIAIVRRWMDAFNRRDFDSALQHVDPDVELHEWPEAPGAQSYRGPEGVRRALDTWFEIWEWMQVHLEEVREVDDRVLFVLHQRAKGKGSAAEVEIRSFNVYTFRNGRVARIELFTEREPALAAAGLIANSEEEKK